METGDYIGFEVKILQRYVEAGLDGAGSSSWKVAAGRWGVIFRGYIYWGEQHVCDLSQVLHNGAVE